MRPDHPELMFARLEELADDIGRLRKRLTDDELGIWACDRIAGHVLTIAGFLEPPAAQLVACGVAIEEALRVVDERAAKLERRLGLKAAA